MKKDAATLPTRSAIKDLFEIAAEEFSNKVAVVFGAKAISYTSLNSRSNQLAHYLQRLGAGRNALIGICLDQSIEKVIAFIAVLKAGGAYVPIDPTYPEERIRYIQKDTQFQYLIIKSGLPEFNDVAHTISMDDPAQLEELNSISTENLERINLPDDLAYIIYTSGSTGSPKGVMVMQKNLLNFLTWFGGEIRINHNDIVLQMASFSFDASVIDLWLPLVHGATVHLYPDNRVLGAYLEDFIREHRISVIPFLSTAGFFSLSAANPSTYLKTICFGGETYPDDLIDAWVNKVRLIQIYGPTETTVTVSHYTCKKGVSGKVIGKAGANNLFYILDDEMNQVTDGSIGELYIGGEQVTKGYWNNAVATQFNFIKNPFATQYEVERGWTTLYKTGDYVSLDKDGNLIFEGRRDNQIKLRGYRIEIGEIETVINGIGNVRQGLVHLHEDQFMNRFLAAYIVFKHPVTEEEARMELQRVKEAVMRILPAHMVPLQWKWMQDFPLLPNGKVDKRSLRPDVDSERKVSLDGIHPDDFRNILVRIFSVFLGQEAFQPDDDFFSTGVNSLTLARVYAALPISITKWIKLPDFFVYRSPMAIAEELMIRIQTKEPSVTEKQRAVMEEVTNDILLDEHFEVRGEADLEALKNPAAIFLTGATGLVGSQLLLDLLRSTETKIHCLVRAKDPDSGWERLKQTFSKFLLPWPDEEINRISIVCGDLTRPFMGIETTIYEQLSAEIDVIYHSASSVSYIEPYPTIKKVNIDGLKGILAFAAYGKTKPLVLLSSIGVFSWGRPFTGKTWMNEGSDIDENLIAVSKDLGYIKSKWVMEKITRLAMQKGLPVINLRLGFAVCNSLTGATAWEQWWGALVRTCIEIGAFPLVMGLKDELTTVDYMTQAIVHIGKRPDAVGKNFHLTPLPENDVSLTDFFSKINEYFGIGLKGIPYQQWLDLWKHNSNMPLFPLLGLFVDDVHEGRSLVESYENTYYFSRDNTEAFLAGTSIKPPVFDRKLMAKYLQFMGVLA